MKKKEKLYSIPEIAEILDVESYEIYNLLRTKKLKGYHMAGSRWRISETHINDYLNKIETTEETNED